MPTPAQMSFPAAKHLNRGLFSDYYLDHIVPTLPEYLSTELHAQAKAVRDDLRALLDTIQPASLDEAQLEDRWIKPVLARLGHHWSVQVKIRYRERGHRKPDYVFTATNDDANALTAQIVERESHLNAVVYAAFNLTPDEIALIERSTRYPYGAV